MELRTIPEARTLLVFALYSAARIAWPKAPSNRVFWCCWKSLRKVFFTDANTVEEKFQRFSDKSALVLCCFGDFFFAGSVRSHDEKADEILLRKGTILKLWGSWEERATVINFVRLWSDKCRSRESESVISFSFPGNHWLYTHASFSMRIESTFLATCNFILILGSNSSSEKKLDFWIQPCAIELSPLTRK